MAITTATLAQTAMEFYKTGRKWSPSETFKHCKLYYQKLGTTLDGRSHYLKVIERDNGTKIMSQFIDGKCLAVEEANKIGTINTRYNEPNYDRIIDIESSIFGRATILKRNGRAMSPTFKADWLLSKIRHPNNSIVEA